MTDSLLGHHLAGSAGLFWHVPKFRQTIAHVDGPFAVVDVADRTEIEILDNHREDIDKPGYRGLSHDGTATSSTKADRQIFIARRTTQRIPALCDTHQRRWPERECNDRLRSPSTATPAVAKALSHRSALNFDLDSTAEARALADVLHERTTFQILLLNEWIMSMLPPAGNTALSEREAT